MTVGRASAGGGREGRSLADEGRDGRTLPCWQCSGGSSLRAASVAVRDHELRSEPSAIRAEHGLISLRDAAIRERERSLIAEDWRTRRDIEQFRLLLIGASRTHEHRAVAHGHPSDDQRLGDFNALEVSLAERRGNLAGHAMVEDRRGRPTHLQEPANAQDHRTKGDAEVPCVGRSRRGLDTV